MIANDLVKGAIVTRLKADAGIVARLPDGTKGVRESNWRGSVFAYPAVRVELESQVDTTPNTDCPPSTQTWSVLVFSEEHSSQEADEIAGLIVTYLRGSSFTLDTVKFQKVYVLESIPAIPVDEHTWRAQVRCQSIIYTV